MLDRLGRWIGGDGAASPGRRRTGRMVATGSASVLTTLVSLGVGFAVTPLLVRHLGGLQYGIYATLASVVTWLGLTHLGLAPSVLNELSTEEMLDSPSRGATIVSSATAVQLVMTGLLVAGIAVAAPMVSWADLFNAPPFLESAVSAAAVIMFGAVALGLPLSLGASVFEAHQRGYVAQAWQLLSALLRLALVVMAVALEASLAGIVLALTAPRLLALAGQYAHAFWRSYPSLKPRLSLVSWQQARGLMSVGVDFLVLNVATLVITSTDYLVITRVVGPAAVTPYAVTSQLTQLPTMFILLALQAAWPAYREAASADVLWLRRTDRRMKVLAAGLAVIGGGALLVIGRTVIRFWAGPDAVPSFGLLFALVGIALVQSVLLPRERILIALGATRINALTGIGNAAINLPVSILLGRTWGVTGVAIGTIVGYVSIGWVILVVARRKLSQLDTAGLRSHR